MARFVSFLVLVAILIVIAVVFFRVMAGFIIPLFLAALLGVVVQPLHRWILGHTGGYRYVAAGITSTLVLVAVLLPLGLVVTTATLEGLSLIDQLQLGNVRSKLDDLRGQFGLNMPREGDLRRIEATLRRWRLQQRQGISPDATPEVVTNLLERVSGIDQWLQEQGDAAPGADVTKLREKLVTLRDSAPESVVRDEALIEADAEFREFKRNLLGGTYRAFLTEFANPTDDQLDHLRAATLSRSGSVVSFGGDTLAFFGKLLFGIIIMVVALFFLLAEGARMLNAIVRVSPLEEQHVRALVAEFDRACRAIVSATLLSAVAQGLLAGIGFYFVGLESSVALLMLLTMVLALVPFVGAIAVWLPVSLYLYFYQHNTWAAVGLAIYGGVIISQVDNVIKPYVLSGQSNLHPLLALLSVLGGIQALGPIGILVGPMVVVFLQTLLKLLQRELSALDKSTWTAWPGFAAWTGRKPPEPPPPAAPPIGPESPPATSTDASVPAASITPPPASKTNGKNGGSAASSLKTWGWKKRRK
jgi:predicted PurR-regulated permease PerM